VQSGAPHALLAPERVESVFGAARGD
jgi:hypothetical protein